MPTTCQREMGLAILRPTPFHIPYTEKAKRDTYLNKISESEKAQMISPFPDVRSEGRTEVSKTAGENTHTHPGRAM